MSKKSRKNSLGRYVCDAPTGAAVGMYSTLILGVCLTYLGRLPYMGIFVPLGEVLKTHYVIGCAVGCGTAAALGADRYSVCGCGAVGAVAYRLGGPVAALLSAMVAGELGTLVRGKSRGDVFIVPVVTVLAGGIFARLTGGYIGLLMDFTGRLIMSSTAMHPALMGLVIGTSVGLLSASPVSGVFICSAMNISGVAAGAATVGCCTFTVGFAIVGYEDNGILGVLAHGLGTAMFQTGNILRRPLIVVPALITSAILSPVATTLVIIENTSIAAGMGTGGLVGLIGAYEAIISSGEPSSLAVIKVVVMLVIAPLLLNFLFGALMKKRLYIKNGEMTIYKP